MSKQYHTLQNVLRELEGNILIFEMTIEKLEKAKFRLKKQCGEISFLLNGESEDPQADEKSEDSEDDSGNLENKA